MATPVLATVLKRRAAVSRRARRGRKAPPQTQPDGIRRAYFQALRAILRRCRELVEERLVPLLPELVADADAQLRSDHGSLNGSLNDRTDALPPGRRVNALMDAVSERLYSEFPQRRLEELGEEYGRRTADFEREQLGKQMRSLVGIDPPLADAKLGPMIQAFTAENVGLIQSIPEAYFDDVRKRTLRAISDGTRATDLAKELVERYTVSESRAKLIANDQIGKFFGAMNEVRQKELGVDSYVWRTSSDNRVREEHRFREGKKYRWDDPPEDGHPGEPINCRCYAEPDLDAILASL